ncbi:hypothetical protein H1R20_g7242, partial [Candolleomyces eurysporus]
MAEGFMFGVAAVLIIGETWRSSRNQSKRRDSVDDQLEDLGAGLVELKTRVDTLAEKWEVQLQEEKQRNDELARILERVVEIGLRGGWAEFQDSPVQLPRVQLGPRPSGSSPSLSIEREDSVDLPKEEHSISDLPPHDTKIDVAKAGGKGGPDKGKSKDS